MPRKEGMERKDLLAANVKIFKSQERLSPISPSPPLRFWWLAIRPIRMPSSVPSTQLGRSPPAIFSAMTRLDHNRASAQVALKAGVTVGNVKNVIIWGNHSSTQFPDVKHAKVNKVSSIASSSSCPWTWSNLLSHRILIDCCSHGGSEVDAYSAVGDAAWLQSGFISVRGVVGTPAGTWVSMAVPSDGSYGVPEGE
ncbi:hypothetical protein PENTCL1PPCAC_2176, partial [Pristionchus entomophagus]